MNETIHNKLETTVVVHEELFTSKITAGTMGTFSIFENVIAILAIVMKRHTMSRACRLVANLALSDCLTGVEIIGFIPVLTFKSLLRNELACSRVYAFLLFCSCAQCPSSCYN